MTRRFHFMKKTALLLVAATLLSLCPFTADAASLASSPLVSGATQNGMVRVYLSSMGNPSALNITVSGSYTVNGSSTKTLASGSSVTVRFDASTGRLTLTANGSTSDMGAAFKLRRHATSGTNGLKIAQAASPNNLYPGDLSFIVRQTGTSYKLYTIAYIYIEDYLYGVLPYEMNNSCPLEALKAQAVASRTYTLRAMTAAATKNIYDVVDTTSDQVYRGTPTGNINCVSAVDQTKGIVSMNGSTFTATYYTASNGGQTESVKNAWNNTANGYLSVKDDPYDLMSAGARVRSFTINASGTQGNSAFGAILSSKAAAVFGAGASVTRIYSVVPHTPKYLSPSRLYTKLDLSVSYTRSGASYSGTLTFDIFSELEEQLNMSINSGDNELWTADAVSSGFIVRARRYGHGIGMSQNGAMQMANMGYTYDQILAFYFTDCRRVQYTLTRSILSAVVEGGDSTEQIIPESPAEIVGGTGCTGVVRLISSDYTLPLRASAQTTGEVLISLPNSAAVDVYGQSGDYYLVSYGRLVGYALRDSLAVSGQVPAVPSVSPTALYGWATVKTTLNFRQTADQNGKVLATLNIGETLPVFSVTGKWAYVQRGLLAGYVHTDYITLSGTGGGTSGISPDAVGAIVSTATPLRCTAGTSGYIAASLPVGAEVAMLSKNGAWTMIRYNKITGYVLTSALTPTGRTTAQTAQDVPAPGESYATVTSSTALNLRDAPNLSGTLMLEMPGKSTMIIESRGAEWSTVRYQGVRGYAMSKYITFGASVPIPTQTPVEGALYAKVTTNSSSLNLRSDRSATSKILAYIPKGTIVALTQYGSDWCATSYNGKSGYVMTRYLTLTQTSVTAAPVPTPTPTPTPIATPTPAPVYGARYARVTTRSGSLNLRESASGGSRVLTTIPRNATITLSSYSSSWCGTTYNGYSGYVMTSFLTLVSSPVATPTPTPAATPMTIASYARVTTRKGSLNLREGASDGSRVLTTIPQYTTIPVLSYGAVWTRTSHNGYTGYVMTKFLTLTAAQTAAPAQSNDTQRDPTLAALPVPATARISPIGGTYLNLRAGCSMNATVVKQMPTNDYLTVLELGENWCKVEYEGSVGYCLRGYLSINP